MQRATIAVLLASTASLNLRAQILIDSIPLPGISQGFWGIHVTPDTIFLGADFSGSIYFYSHQGTLLGSQPTGYDFNHGLVREAGSYLIAEDYTANGAGLYRVGLDGAPLGNWTFPPVIGGNSSGIGDLCADGNAVWYTMYFPDFDVYPYAYAYKWVPGDPSPIDTVPMFGEQPYGIALRGDTLYYVTDNLNGDLERIYAYDLANDEHIGSVALPDSDNDQSPRGLFFDGSHLYLVANRSGGAAFAFQTIFIYAFDPTLLVPDDQTKGGLRVHPVPADQQIMLDGVMPGSQIEVLDMCGRMVLKTQSAAHRASFDVSTLPSGPYAIMISSRVAQQVVRCMIEH
ncbi:MAG TPA: hypothetical protein PKY96_09685 [Flavobacteriales bacterium]|nr:hypothetical protein [Flavobacteriales bacterium]